MMDFKEFSTEQVGKPLLKFTRSSTRWIALGAWLAFLFYVNITMVLMSLTAHQLLHKISLIEVNGQAVSITRVREFKYDLDTIDKRLETAKANFVDESEALTGVDSEVAALAASFKAAPESTQDEKDAKKKINADWIEKAKFRNDVVRCRKITAKNHMNWMIIQNVRTFNDTLLGYGFEAKRYDKVTIPDIPHHNSKPCDHIDYSEWNSEKYLLVDDKIRGILDDFSYFSALQLGDENENGEKSKWRWVRVWQVTEFSDMPIELLTIMLVLCMGALGGSIRLTRAYLLHEENENLANYFFFPLLGSVTAFAVYVLAKAGVLIISDSGSAGSGGSLSPYFISFIGLVSGMLADNALDTIQRVGGGWFKNAQTGRDRWGVRLAQRCADNGETLTSIANLTARSPGIVQGWLDDTAPVPPFAQQLIAARLGMPVRELFSDIQDKSISLEPEPVPDGEPVPE